MCKANGFSPCVKVFYRPIEAAIRWSGLSKFESRILKKLGNKRMPSPGDFPRWPLLHLSTERLFDGMLNGELPYGRQGITCADPTLLDDPDLTIRHVDLRAWIAHYYPDQKPAFLFDDIERHVHPAISTNVVQALLAEREAWKAEYATCSRALETLSAEHQVLLKVHADLATQVQQHPEPGQRGEATYLNIIGGLLNLMLGHSPSGVPYSQFRTQDAVISALIAHHEGRMGITQRTLETKFAAARRRFTNT